MSVLYITVTPKNGPPKQYRFTKRKIFIGSVPGNDIVLEDNLIARRHCKITLEGERLFLAHISSTAKTRVGYTYLGNMTLGNSIQLHPKDSIRMGDTLLRVYLDEAEDEGATEESLLEKANDRTQTPWELSKETALLRRILAARPDAPPWLLEQLSARADLKTLQAIAQNPNTPPKVLSVLAGCCAQELLQNPSLPLLFLEDPLLSQLSTEAICILLQQEDFPEKSLLLFTKHEEEKIRYAVASSPKASPELLASIPIYRGEQRVLNAILATSRYPKDWLEGLCQNGAIEQRELLARAPDLPEYAVEILARDPEEEVRWWIARRTLPRAVLLSLVRDPASRVRLRLTEHLQIQADADSKELVSILAQDQDPQIRAQIASLFITPDEILEGLCCDLDDEVRKQAKRRLLLKT